MVDAADPLVDAACGRPCLGPKAQQCLAHFGPLVESLAASDQVRDVAVSQRLLHGRRLGVDPEQHCHLPVGDPSRGLPYQPVGDCARIGGLVRGLGELDLGTSRLLCLEGDSAQPAASGRSHDLVRAADDLRGRAVVPDQPDDLGRTVAAGETGQESCLRAGEGVDGLRRVADHADLLPVAAPELEQRFLQRVDVLVLIDHQMPIGAADGVGHLAVLGDQGGGAEQDVLEVDPRAVSLGRLVPGEDPRDRARVERGDDPVVMLGKPRVVLGSDVADLRPGDLRDQVTQLRRVDRDPQPAGRLGDQRHPVVEDLGQLAAVDLRPEVLRLSQRSRVEGSRLDPVRAELLQPAAQLPRRAGREGDRQDVDRVVHAGRHPVRDPVGDGPGLSRSRRLRSPRPVRRGWWPPPAALGPTLRAAPQRQRRIRLDSRASP